MDNLVDISPPVALKLKLSEQWFEQMISSFLPFDIQQEKIHVQLLEPFEIKITTTGIIVGLDLKLKYPFKLMGSISGAARMKLTLSNLADIEMVDVKLLNLDWIEGPRLELNKFVGFSIQRFIGDQIKKATNRIEQTLQEGLSAGFKAFTEENPFYDSLLNQTVSDYSLQIKTKIKTLYYQFVPGNRWLDLQLFPELILNIADKDNEFIGSPGPFKPGVGGGQIEYSLDLSTKYINELIAPKVSGQELKAGSKVVKIQDVVLGIGSEGFTVNVSFEGNDPPRISGLVIPFLNVQRQLIEFDIQHLEMQEASWFWRGLLSLLKSSIENRLEETLKINIGKILRENSPKLKEQLLVILEKQQLQLKVFQPAFCITQMLPSASGLAVNGTMGGTLEVWSNHLIESNQTEK